MKMNFYLQHPLMAMSDPRMINLVEKEGLRGSGAYWFIIEKLSMLPEPCAGLEYLRPFCHSKKVPLAYLKKIIFEYQLFCIEEDGFFMPEELNPRRKKTPKVAESTEECADSKAKKTEIEQKTSKDTVGIEPKNEDSSLIYTTLPKSDTDNTKENIKDTITTAAATEEKEETAAAAELSTESSNGGRQLPPVSPDSPLTVCDDFDNPQRPLRPIRPWRELADNLLDENSSWLELAYMRSGYGKLLQRHLKQAVEIFKQHIEAYGKGGDMLEMKDIQGYFINYVNSGSRTSKALKDSLKSLDAKERAACPDTGDPYRFEQLVNGVRTYQGCPIPADAPPRPDATAFWDEQQHLWITEQKPKS